MKKLIFEEIINVPYKGDRNYVYASDLFNLIIDKLDAYKIFNLSEIDYSIHDIMKNKVILSLYSLDENINIDEDADAKIFFKSSNMKYVGLITESDIKITERTNYDENDIFTNSTTDLQNSSIDLSEAYSKYTNLDVLTSMNKRLLSEIRPDIKGKWLSVRLQLDNLSDLLSERKHLTVKLKKIFSNKYSRSELYNDYKKIGNLYFSVV